MSSKLLRGTFILTLGTFVSKLLGLLYVIPFSRIVGPEGTILYQYAYVPYTIFLSMSTAGIPLAISKFIAKYNAIEEYSVGRRLFKSGIWVMMASGIIWFAILMYFAPEFAAMFTDAKENQKLEETVTVIRAVSFALIIIPFMSLIRGFFQGHQSMGPSAVSQVVEQIVRIVFLLGGAYVVLNLMDGSIVDAASVATFAAFIGGIGGLFVLFWYWYKRKPHLDQLLQHDKGTVDISLKDMYKEIIIYSIPFIFVGIANPLFQLIDLLTFNRTMDAMGVGIEESESLLNILNFETHKIVIIPVTLAISFSLTLIPSITKSFMDADQASLNRQMNQSLQVMLFLTLPAAVGVALLAEPVYTLFYTADIEGAAILRTYAPVAVLFALFSVTAAILQGINEQRFTVLSLLAGILVKLSLNVPFIKWMETEGAIYATAIGYLTAIAINFYVIKLFSGYRFRFVFRRSLLIVIFTGIMFVITFILYKVLTNFLSPESVTQSVILVFLCGAIGAGVYFYLGIKSRLVYFLFGDKVDRLLSKLRLK
ncbi:putative polysaccharide biosynthesis protein [Bacillus mesophilum]|uniref:Polysaccharide biosynthesis protein n=1 Tax=Bacillus mesophilum TaxID=1071718 RepID=A0A7V7RHW2_9BACI|nr:polysaccharide biosynthesis protein [Bacillus mesophilum]KAB2329320.1 polysaccharide biosynthesis protein [Bacillus mesophilum]